ncbi:MULTISPECIES: TonB-dependent receptor domain-containing protein [unclassified Helicobacter]|uniref:TonB-dependent receptor domain-containing protein n=1 Tax=unclassified Helicobacter TaxID=2593540 RepID=UPI000CF0F457|nr:MULTISPECIES: TonB-dependent receptor [unclassified Helicobacter]
MKRVFISCIFVELLLAEDLKQYNINQVVTSASGFNQALKDAPASISVVSGEELKDKPVRDLGEAVSLISGVSIDQEVGKTGAYSISIRGMPSDYTLILIDGKRQNTTNVGFQNESLTSFMPPISAIERIEVIRGPASTLYGSDAIGGIVNIITKKQLDKWGGSLMIDTVLQEKKTFGNLYGISLWAGGPLDANKKWTLSLRLREQYRAKVPTSALKVLGTDAVISPRNVVGLSQSNNSNLGFRVGYNLDRENYLYFDFDHGLQWYDNSQNLLGVVSPRGGYAKNLFFSRNNLILAHQGTYEKASTDTSIQYNSTLSRGRLVPEKSVSAGSPLIGQDRGLLGQDVILDHKTVFGIGDFSNMTLGGRYWFASVYDKIIPNYFVYQHNVSLFAENETRMFDSLNLTLGFRQNYNSAFGFNASPRIYLVYDALKNPKFGNLILKGGISTGYKTPRIPQLVAGVNGLTAQGTVQTYGNPDLRPETSINYEVGMFYETSLIELSSTLFYIDFKDKIQTASVANGMQVPVTGGGICVAANGKSCTYDINADTARSYGLESFFGFKPYDIGYGNIGFNLSYTFNKTEQTSGVAKGLPLTRIPEHSLNGAINYTIQNFGFYLRGEFKAKQLRTQIATKGGTGVGSLGELENFRRNNPGLSEYYKPYFLLHLGGNYRINKNLKLHFGIYNLLDQNFVDYVSVTSGNSTYYLNNYNYVREGRRYYLSLNMDF